ncbi:DUF6950 family protein [Rhizobium ruizarguesonis]|uniref:DUF6950 domain-containing protein n=2 Tax=Rhizobium TaxID=379 RepID=A0A179BV45_RHILE|nr:hypothetical protein [Rhizobium leguminosarum]OAP95093.1 hypothetical protein A4U53_17880 [Rhizobium leguminosarum]
MAELVVVPSARALAAFFADHNTRHWRPCQVDCCMFLASWAMWLGHSDPASHLRGTYDSDDGFRAIIAGAGGVVPVVERCVASIGGHRADGPQLGVIGVIGSPTNIQRQWGAIFDGERWLVRFHDHVGPMAARPLAIWKI